jgi:hypothetical protein
MQKARLQAGLTLFVPGKPKIAQECGQMQIFKIAEIEMTRDMDLIRDLLLFIENNPKCDGSGWIQFSESDFSPLAKSPQEIRYHLFLLIEAGFLRGQAFGGQFPLISKLTWNGHEFLDDVRDQGIWIKTKERIQGLGGVALSVVAEIAKAEIKARLGLS